MIIYRLKHNLRRIAARKLEPHMRYTSYPISEKEHLGTFDGSKADCIAMLKQAGYHYQMFAAIKLLDGVEDQGSYARIPDQHPEAVIGTALKDLSPKECQYHVHLYEEGDSIKLYGHYEIHPYPWTPTMSVQRSIDHYDPTYGDTYLKGVVDPRLQKSVE